MKPYIGPAFFAVIITLALMAALFGSQSTLAHVINQALTR